MRLVMTANVVRSPRSFCRFCGDSSAVIFFALNAQIRFWVRLPADGRKAMDFEI